MSFEAFFRLTLALGRNTISSDEEEVINTIYVYPYMTLCVRFRKIVKSIIAFGFFRHIYKGIYDHSSGYIIQMGEVWLAWRFHLTD